MGYTGPVWPRCIQALKKAHATAFANECGRGQSAAFESRDAGTLEFRVALIGDAVEVHQLTADALDFRWVER